MGVFPKRLRVEVRPSDIRHGRKMNPCTCALARAVLRAFPARTEVSVGFDAVQVYTHEDGQAVYTHTARSQQFVTDFDDGKAVPGTFELRRGGTR